MDNSIEGLTQELSPLTSKIINHSLYNYITSIDDLKTFMGEHVFAVWDFMCLLKELHRRIVSTSAPWFPPKDALSANLINRILVEEEGDLTEDGQSYSSHYDIYISAMQKIGANTQPIQKLLAMLDKGYSLPNAIDLVPLRPGTKKFVLTTFSFFNRPTHELAAAFVYGREGITSSMFIPMVNQLEKNIDSKERDKLSTLIYYFKRHITLDDNEHFPKALKMLTNLIGRDMKKVNEVKNAAIQALEARLEFLTDIQSDILEK